MIISHYYDEDESGKYSYSYDALSRLTEVHKDGAQIRSFDYDEFGNRSQMTEHNNTTSYTYNALNQLISTSDTKGIEQHFSYDKRGNLTQILENNIIKNTYEFGAINRLTKATNATGQIASYYYNGFGHRVGKQVADNLSPTKHISYVLDLTKQYHNLLQMQDDTQTQNYTWDNNVAFADGNAYLQDELGSPLRYIDNTGSTIDSYGYSEFGDDLYGNQGIKQPFGYTGYTADHISSTYFAQAREYMPHVGRFAGEDIVKDGSNWYTYCYGNPLKYVDNNGLFAQNPPVWHGDDYYWNPDNPHQPVPDIGEATSQSGSGNWFSNAVSGIGNTLYNAFSTIGNTSLTNSHAQVQAKGYLTNSVYIAFSHVGDAKLANARGHVLNKYDGGVHIFGVSGNASIGVGASGSLGIFSDGCRNSGMVFTVSPSGGVSIGTSATGFLTRIEVPCVSVLLRADHTVDAGAGLFFVIGGSYTHSLILIENEIFHGSTITIGAGKRIEVFAEYPFAFFIPFGDMCDC